MKLHSHKNVNEAVPIAAAQSGEGDSGHYKNAAEGLITLRSSHGPEETMRRLEAEVKAVGMIVFARIDLGRGDASRSWRKLLRPRFRLTSPRTGRPPGLSAAMTQIGPRRRVHSYESP